MLSIIYGNNREKGREQFRKVRESARAKCDNEHSVQENTITSEFLDEMSISRGLFGERTLFIFDSVLEKKEYQTLIASCAQELQTSPNFFLLFEPSFDKKIVTTIETAGVILKEFTVKKMDTRPSFNIFSLGDALGKRNKKELWVLYHSAISVGFEPEEICGTLFWTLKNIAIIKNSPDSTKTKLNPFVAKKTLSFTKNYTQKEISTLSHSLITAYHEAHISGEPMPISLEKFILQI
jgi:hypothetical protein